MQESKSYWEKSGTYTMELTLKNRDPQHPEYLSRETLTDSTFLVFSIDSIRTDSAFMSYEGDLAVLGIIVGATGHSTGKAIGISSKDSVSILLEPHIIDATLQADGLTNRVGTVSGNWYTEAPPRGGGTFIFKKNDTMHHGR